MPEMEDLKKKSEEHMIIKLDLTGPFLPTIM